MHTNVTNIETTRTILHKNLSYILTGLCFKVHNELGRFCKERQYGEALEQLLKMSDIAFQKEVEIKTLNNNSPLGNKADFIIDNLIILELKAKRFVTKEDYYQIQRYLEGANLQLGLIINFRSEYLKPKRIINKNFH